MLINLVLGQEADRRLDVFALDSENESDLQSVHIATAGLESGWEGWRRLAGGLRGSREPLGTLTVGQNQDGRLQVFALDGGIAISRRQARPNATWAGESVVLGGSGFTQLAVAKAADGRLMIFALDSDGAVHHKAQTKPNGAWPESWSPFGGSELRRIVAAQNADGRLELIALGDDGAAYHKWQRRTGGWSKWTYLGVSIHGHVSLRQLAVSNGADGRLELFSVDVDGAAYHSQQNKPNGTWRGSDWARLTGPAQGALKQLAVARNQDGRLELFSLDADGGVHHKWQLRPNGAWKDNWSSLGGQELRRIAVGNNANGRLDLFALSGDRVVYHRWQLTPNGGWRDNWILRGRPAVFS